MLDSRAFIKNYLEFDEDSTKWHNFKYKISDDLYVDAKMIGKHINGKDFIIQTEDGQFHIVAKSDLVMQYIRTFKFCNYLAFDQFGGKSIGIYTYREENGYTKEEIEKWSTFIQWVGDWHEVTVNFFDLLNKSD